MKKLKARRDDIIRQLWNVYAELCDLETTDEGFNEEDLELWSKVTTHSAIQGRINKIRFDRVIEDEN